MANKGKYIQKFILLGTLFTMVPISGYADNEDFASDLTVGAEKSITKRFDVAAEGDIRFCNNDQNLDRLGIGGDASYEVLKKWLKVSAGYEFIADHWKEDAENSFSYRHRANVSLSVKHKVSSWIFSLKGRYQVTWKDERFHAAYKWNPKEYFRLKGEIGYKINSHYQPYVAVEPFWQLNNPDNNVMDDLRYCVGMDYKLDRHNSFDLYFRIDDEMNVEAPEDVYMLCGSYKYSF